MRKYLLLLSVLIPSTLQLPSMEDGLSEMELNILHAEAVQAGNAGEDNMWFNSIDAGLLDSLITQMNSMNKWFARIVKYWDDFTSGKDGSKIYLEGLATADDVLPDSGDAQGEEGEGEGNRAAEEDGEEAEETTLAPADGETTLAAVDEENAEGGGNTTAPAADGANSTATAADGTDSAAPAEGEAAADPADPPAEEDADDSPTEAAPVAAPGRIQREQESEEEESMERMGRGHGEFQEMDD